MKKGNELQANYTVEAALIFPIIFFIVLFMLNYTFFCYDRAKLKTQLDDMLRRSQAFMSYEIDLWDSTVSRGSLANKEFLWVFMGDRKPKEELIKQFCMDELSQGMYVTTLNEVSVESTYTELMIHGTATVKFVGLYWMNGFADYPFEIRLGQSSKIFPREERARILQSMIELGTNIKGIDSILGYVKQLVGLVH